MVKDLLIAGAVIGGGVLLWRHLGQTHPQVAAAAAAVSAGPIATTPPSPSCPEGACAGQGLCWAQQADGSWHGVAPAGVGQLRPMFVQVQPAGTDPCHGLLQLVSA